MNVKESRKKIRGVFEKVCGSGVWWIQYFDAEGRRRREKVGTKGNAIKLYQKRKTEALQGKKLPENLRERRVTLREIAAAALEYSVRKRPATDTTKSAWRPSWSSSATAPRRI